MNKVWHSLRYHIGIAWYFARMSLMSELEYRINFISGMAVEMGYMLFKIMYLIIVYQAGVVINGLSPANIAMFIGVFLFVTGNFMFYYPGFWEIPGHVRNGSLDKLITKPVLLLFITTFNKFSFSMPIPNMTVGLILIIFGWVKSGISATAPNLTGFILLLLGSNFLVYSFFLIPKLLAFWTVADKGMSQLYDAVWDFNNMPMAIYDKWIQVIGTFVIPIFIISNFPVLFVMERLSIWYIIWGVAAPFIMFLIARVVWKRALIRYDGAGG